MHEILRFVFAATCCVIPNGHHRSLVDVHTTITYPKAYR